MTDAIRYWLLSNDVKEQIRNYILNALTSWSSHWGFHCSHHWRMRIQSLNTVGEVDLDTLSNKVYSSDKFVLGLDSRLTLVALKKMIMQVDKTVFESSALNAIVGDCLNDLQQTLTDNHFDNISMVDGAGFLQQGRNIHAELHNVVRVIVINELLVTALYFSMKFIDTIVDDKKMATVDHEKNAVNKRLDSIKNEKARITAIYGSTFIPVDQLSTIKIGDVIRLDQCITDPVPVYDNKGNTLFNGFLGQKDGCYCIQVAEEGI